VYFIALMMFEGYALRDIQMVRPDFFKRVYHQAHGTDAHGDHGASHGGEGHEAGH
jgi:hypothetical protein